MGNKIKLVFEALNKEIELDEKDIRNMVLGTSPYYTAYEHPLVKKCGVHVGGHVDSWSWHLPYDLTLSQLLELYLICKNSWK